MNSHLILQQHMPFATMISKALDFCQSMLVRSDVLYPFAVVTVNNDINCIFVPNNDQQATPMMIEDLQTQLDNFNKTAINSANLLVYPALVTHPNNTETDALVFNINDTQGHNTVTIYPYKHVESGIQISKPYTCDFSD